MSPKKSVLLLTVVSFAGKPASRALDVLSAIPGAMTLPEKWWPWYVAVVRWIFGTAIDVLARDIRVAGNGISYFLSFERTHLKMS